MTDTKTKIFAEKKVIEYGNQRIPVDAGVSLEQAKQQMARFFPELADPKVETKKAGTETTWVFSKKAGTKGATPAKQQARIVARLRRLPRHLAVPQAVVDAIRNNEPPGVDDYKLERSLVAQVKRVKDIRRQLLDVPGADRPTGDVL